MKKIILAVAAAGCLMGCLNNNRRANTSDLPEDEQQILQQDVTDVDENVYDLHTAVNSLDYAGTYKGVVPCADCPGIETIITLEEDGTYKMSTEYLERNDGEKFLSSGTYRWDSDGNRISLHSEGENSLRYFVGEGYLYQLDLEGNRIEGSLAEHYKLTKES